MDPTSTPALPPRRPGSPGVHRLGLAVAAVTAVVTLAGAAAFRGTVAPAPTASGTPATLATDTASGNPPPQVQVRTVYVPAPQPTAGPQQPVQVVVVNKPSQGDDEGPEHWGD